MKKMGLRVVFCLSLLGLMSSPWLSVAHAETSETSEKQKKSKSKELDSAKADAPAGLYVYIDKEGIPHYALQKLDDNYQLVENSSISMESDVKWTITQPVPDWEYRADRSMRDGGMWGGSRRLPNAAGLARYESIIRKHASAHGVDVNLIKAVMAAESGFNANAISPKNAMGLMQVIPATGARYGLSPEQLMNPERNIYAGVRYLKDLSRMFKGRPDLIVAAYNAGEGAVYKYNRQIPPYAETQNYVRKVMQYYQVFSGGTLLADNGVNVKIRGNQASKASNTSGAKNAKVIKTSGKAKVQ